MRLIPEYSAKKRCRQLEGVFRTSVAFVGVVAVGIAHAVAALIHVFSDRINERINEHHMVPLQSGVREDSEMLAVGGSAESVGAADRSLVARESVW